MKGIIIFSIVLLAIQMSFGQKYKNKGDVAFEDFEYTDAIDYYTKHLQKNPNDKEVLINLAECYKSTNQLYKAEAIYEQLNDQISNDPKIKLDYAFVLLSNGKTSLAKKEVKSYLDNYPYDERANILLKSCEQQMKFEASKDRFNIIEANFNSDVSDFSPSYFKDKVIFTSERGGKTDSWTGRSYTNLFSIENGQTPQQLEGNFPSKYHNGSSAFLGDNIMLFTRNNSHKTKNGSYNLIIEQAELINGKWEIKGEFPYNDKNFNVAYPAVSPSKDYIIFSSDMPGGRGGMDLYMSMYSNGKWQKPVNLYEINSQGNDMFPFIDNANTLYFSSDGRAGMGGLDIFYTKFENKKSGEIINPGAPINSSRDDFGLITKDGLKTGYLSSNRNNDDGIDNILEFQKNKEALKITGIVIDEWTKMPLKETVVTLYNETNGEEYDITTGENGRFEFTGTTDTKYSLQGIKNDILTTKEDFSTSNTSPDEPLYYTLIHNDPRFSLEGYALNVKDKLGVEDVNVSLYNKSNISEEKAITDSEGFFKFQLDQNSDFEISGVKNGYYTSVSTATTKGLNRSTTLYVKLFLTIEEVVIGETKILGKETFGGWEFENIYYDLDKYNIRPDAAIALDKVVDFLQANPGIKIELGSHTDSRASDNYNMTLSQNRANSAVQYIVSKGITESRISAMGYGETKLTNRCSDGVPCSEEEHQMNRRTEITVTGYDK